MAMQWWLEVLQLEICEERPWKELHLPAADHDLSDGNRVQLDSGQNVALRLRRRRPCGDGEGVEGHLGFDEGFAVYVQLTIFLLCIIDFVDPH